MALILDPIESGINSLLAPFTSVASSTDLSINDPSTSTSAVPLASSIIVITPIASSKTSTSTVKTTSTGKSTSSAHATSGKDASSSTTLPSTPTTLVTSTTSSSSTTSSTDSSSSSTTTDSTTSLSASSPSPPVPTPFPSAPSAASSSSNTNSQPSSSSPSAISTAGIVIAIIFTVAIIASIVWLVARFCPPVRSRIDAWTAKRRRERSYREALDGPAVPAKDSGEPYSASSSDHSYARDRHFSFFAFGRNPQIGTNPAVVHQQFVSPNSANTPRGHGLGLGRVSLLRNHSLLRRAGQDVPEVPSMMREVPTSRSRQSMAGTTPMPVSIERGHGGKRTTMTRGRNSPLPRLHVDIPHGGMDAGYGHGDGSVPRVSQIGLAVTGTPR